MAASEIEDQFKQVVAAVAAILRPLGYRKSGTNFRRSRDDGNVTIVAFQRSTTSDAYSIRFTANVGVVSKELLRR